MLRPRDRAAAAATPGSTADSPPEESKSVRIRRAHTLTFAAAALAACVLFGGALGAFEEMLDLRDRGLDPHARLRRVLPGAREGAVHLWLRNDPKARGPRS